MIFFRNSISGWQRQSAGYSNQLVLGPRLGVVVESAPKGGEPTLDLFLLASFQR